MAILDFHLHLFSRTCFETLAALSPQPGDVPHRLADLEQRLGIEIPPADLSLHVRRWLDSMDANGVERAAAFASVPEETPILARARELSAGRLTPFALVNPRVKESPARVENLIATQGFAGVLLFPALHHYELDSTECAALFSVLDRHRAIAFVHCGELIVKLRDVLGIVSNTEPKFANPMQLIAPAERFPDARFVIPHFGAGRFDETLEAGRRTPNIFVDTSSSNAWMKSRRPPMTLQSVFSRTLEVFTPQRILFGTDSTTFPKGWQRPRYDEQHSALKSLDLSPADLTSIFHTNATTLLSRLTP